MIFEMATVIFLGGFIMSNKNSSFKEDILHISVGDSSFETLEGKLDSSFAPDYARRCGVDVNDCGDFFVNCNLATGTVKVCATYYPPTNEPGAVIYVPLEESEKGALLQAMENCCRKQYKMDGIQILNSERNYLGLSPIQARKETLDEQISSAAQNSQLHSKDFGSKTEQKDLKER